MSDTIFAVATGAGRAALAVLRISGPATAQIVSALAGGRLPQPRRASLRRLRAPGSYDILDSAVVLWFPAPKSYTGEDCAELGLHAGRGVTGGVADALVQLGARPAEPGEFTRRAVRSGRLDLAQAEAVADLAAAETAAQRRLAMAELDGTVSALCREWSTRLDALLAEAEARLDFPDEDLPPCDGSFATAVNDLRRDIAAALATGEAAERVRDGLTVAIVGAPNVGKSSLLNALAGRDAAIVSPHPGTTRDVIEVRMDVAGMAVTLLDTAGLRPDADVIEAEGIRRARLRAAAADIVLSVCAPDAPSPAFAAAPGPAIAVVANKIDLGWAAPEGAIAVSAQTGAGLDALRARLADLAGIATEGAGPVGLARARHRAAGLEACAALERALLETDEVQAEELRRARAAIGRITGRTSVDAVLDEVFARFCIGK